MEETKTARRNPKAKGIDCLLQLTNNHTEYNTGKQCKITFSTQH